MASSIPAPEHTTTSYAGFPVLPRPLPTTTPTPTASPDSPPPSPRPDLRSKQSRPRLSRPPTLGGGPLSSHPALDYIAAAWPPTPEPDMESNISIDTSTKTRSRNDSCNSPTSPNTVPMHSTTDQQRPGKVRRLLSLSSLRQSFSSSRTSLSQPPGTSHSNYQASFLARAESPNDNMSSTASTAPPASTRTSNEQRPIAALRKKRSSSWFKRKSTIFGANDDWSLDVLDEDGPEHKKFKDIQLPTLPEIESLGGGRLDGGSIGWDEQLFTTRN